MEKILELTDLIEMDSLPNVEDLIRLPSGEVKKFGQCGLDEIQELIIELNVKALMEDIDERR